MTPDPTTGDRLYTDDELEFLQTVQRYKTKRRKPYPRWGDVLALVRYLGYRKTEPREAELPK